jgi:hypothetical protein
MHGDSLWSSPYDAPATPGTGLPNSPGSGYPGTGAPGGLENGNGGSGMGGSRAPGFDSTLHDSPAPRDSIGSQEWMERG